MARAILTKTAAPGSYAAAGVLLTLAAANVVDKNQFVASGNDLVVARNSGIVPHTVTITSAPDEYGRLGNIAAYNIPAGETHIFGPFKNKGWLQSVGMVYLEADHAEILFGIITLP